MKTYKVINKALLVISSAFLYVRRIGMTNPPVKLGVSKIS